MSTLLPPLLSGTLFGASLTASSVYLPSVILGQLSLTSTLMLRTFLTASACSAIIIYLTNRFTTLKLPHRTNTSYGWFGSYDANIIGGMLQGLGMALTGACPGTVLVQIALGIRPAGWILVGSLLGGLGYVFANNKIRRSSSVGVGRGAVVREHTVMQRLKVNEETAVLGYEALLIGAIAAVDRLPLGLSSRYEKFWIGPVAGGLLIGIAQASSVILSKKTLGVSSAYSDVAGHVSSLLKGKGLSGGFGNITFATGVMLGARLASQRLPVIAGDAADVNVSVAAALIGGFCTIFGARMAGGCTSGHGISGMSTLSVSSFFTVAGMFGSGIASRKLLEAF